MPEIVNIPNIITVIFAFVGFLLLLPDVHNKLPFYINEKKAKSVHRFKEKVIKETRILGFVLLALGFIIQIAIQVFK